MRNKIIKITLLCLMAFMLIAADAPALGGLLVQSYEVSQYPDIQLRLSLWDLHGMPMEAFKQENFSLKTSEGEILAPKHFEFKTDADVKIALALDVSASMRGLPLADAKSASYRFLDRMNDGDQISLIAFSDKVSLYRDQFNPERELPFSENLTQVYDMIEGLEASGGTELYNAVYKAVELTSQLPKGHRAVLLFSDGRNESSVHDDPEAAIKLAKDEGIPIFVIGLGAAIDQDYLERLSAETGGVARYAPKSSELAEIFDDMASLLKGQYVLGFEMPQLSGKAEESVVLNVDFEGQSVDHEILLEELPEILAENADEPTEVSLTPELYPIVEEPQIEASEATVPALTEAIVTADPIKESTAESGIVDSDNGYDQDKAQKEGEKSIGWYWYVAGVLLLALLTFLILRARRDSNKQKLYKCGRCGYKMSEGEMACKQCGETRKIER